MFAVSNFKNWFETLTPETLAELSEYYRDDIYFKDPFNEFKGIGKLNLIFTHMFEKLKEPHFVFIDIVEGEDSAYLTWDFHFKINNKVYKIHGSSLIKWNNDGKVFYHRDYWDVGEEVLMKIPILKSFYQILYNKLNIA